MKKRGSGGERASLASLIAAHAQDNMRIRAVCYEKGNTVFEVDEPSYWLFCIQKGEVDLVKRTLSGERYTIQRLGPGDLLGLDALCPGHKGFYRTYTAEVIVPLEALLIERGDFWRLMEDPALTRPLFNALCRMLQEGARRLEYLLVGKGSMEKVAGALLCLSRFQDEEDGGDSLPLQVTYAQIASFIGMRAETVCNQMKRLERREALIRRDGAGMILHRRELLKVLGEVALEGSLGRP